MYRLWLRYSVSFCVVGAFRGCCRRQMPRVARMNSASNQPEFNSHHPRLLKISHVPSTGSNDSSVRGQDAAYDAGSMT